MLLMKMMLTIIVMRKAIVLVMMIVVFMETVVMLMMVVRVNVELVVLLLMMGVYDEGSNDSGVGDNDNGGGGCDDVDSFTSAISTPAFSTLIT